MTKRLLDIVVALFAGVLLLPLAVLVACGVLVSSGWPVIFRQTRVGRGGRDFVMLKFRTMTKAPKREAGFHPGDVSRVTAFGRVLRKSKLDELPQLWNVLRGDMSLVGPRPEVRRWVDAFPERWAHVLTVRPGLTDPASLVYSDEESILAAAPDPELAYRTQVLPHKLDLYEEYINTRSFWGDVGLIARTPVVIISQLRRQSRDAARTRR